MLRCIVGYRCTESTRSKLAFVEPNQSYVATQWQTVCITAAGRGVETEKKNPRKKIQTLFLEIVENPPQLHHMTFQKENATLLPPTAASPDFIHRAAAQSPIKQNITAADATHLPPLSFCAFIKTCDRDQREAIATSASLPSRKLLALKT